MALTQLSVDTFVALSTERGKPEEEILRVKNPIPKMRKPEKVVG